VIKQNCLKQWSLIPSVTLIDPGKDHVILINSHNLRVEHIRPQAYLKYY